MEKTTVYLSEGQVEALGRKARATGKSRSELIREGVDLVTNDAPKRVFHSMGIGASDGSPFDTEEYLREHWTQDLLSERSPEPRE